MPYTKINEVEHYYELQGSGAPLVLIHGGFVDARMWDAQFDRFSEQYQVLRYDLRGHGRSGSSSLDRYSMETFADDLSALLAALNLDNPIVCGLSLGGMISQMYAVRNPDNLKALILSDTAVSVSLTRSDKLQRYILFPKWAMLMTLRLMSVETFTRFSFRLARITRNERWFGEDEATRDYIEGAMLDMQTAEYVKIYEAIYDFQLQPLENILCPTLVLNGEFESRSVFRHTEEILRKVPSAEAEIVPGAGHTSNMENPAAYNASVQAFLDRVERF